MTIALPRVSALKCFRSAGRCQGSLLSRPMTRLSARGLASAEWMSETGSSSVWTGLAVGLGDEVAVFVGLGDGVGVWVGLGDGVGVRVALGDGVGVSVRVGDGV